MVWVIKGSKNKSSIVGLSFSYFLSNKLAKLNYLNKFTEQDLKVIKNI